jgi:hypothetical protein
MNRPMTDSETLIAALAEEARSAAPSEDPEPEVLLDYLAGRLSPEEEERLGRQLAASPEAARALLDLADFAAAGAAAGDHPPELAVMAGWRDLRSRLPDATSRPSRPPRWLEAVAASLLLSTLGLGSWAWRLQVERSRPVASVSLELASRPRAGGEPAVALSPGAPLRLVLDPAERCSTYTVKIAGSEGGAAQTLDRQKVDELGNLALLVWLGPGSYRLRLSGCEPRRELEKYPFRITADGH